MGQSSTAGRGSNEYGRGVEIRYHEWSLSGTISLVQVSAGSDEQLDDLHVAIVCCFLERSVAPQLPFRVIWIHPLLQYLPDEPVVPSAGRGDEGWLSVRNSSEAQDTRHHSCRRCHSTSNTTTARTRHRRPGRPAASLCPAVRTPGHWCYPEPWYRAQAGSGTATRYFRGEI